MGPGVDRLAAGDRVAALSFHAYAEGDLVPTGAVIRLPPALDGTPFPGEPLACAVNVFRRADLTAHDTVAVVGVGFLGALLVQLAARAGCRVIAISRRPFARAVATRCGAAETMAMDDRRAVAARVRDLTGGRGADRVIEAVGAQEPLDLAAELTRERGRLVIAGYHQGGRRQIDLQLWNWRGLDVVNAHERDPQVYVEGIRTAAELVAAGDLDPAPLYTHRFPLDRIAEAMRMMEERPEGFMKALILP